MLEQEFTNTLYTNDNLFILNGLNSNLVDLIYLDPPFNSKRTYSAPIGSKAAGTSFNDMWTWADVNEAYLETLADKYPALARFIGVIGKIHSKPMMAYLTYMAQRIIQMHRILKDTGSLYLHCDQTASHYLKILLDDIFGKNNFRNEIVWCYTGPSGAKKNFPAKHDIILRYVKTNEYVFNWKNIRIPYIKLNTGHTHSIFKEPATLPKEGKIPEDFWIDIPSGGHISPKERTGYPTQKPLALLERIIKASSNEGDIVMDPFCGCATTCVAAQQLGRKWIGIDIEKQAVSLLVERLSDDANMFKDFINTALIPQRTDVKIEPPSKSIKEKLYKEQNCLCNACGKEFDILNLEIDHIIPKAKGGGDYYENYQLLCGSCNKIKGNRPMEYLRTKIETREKMLKNKIIFGE
jgi:site-specific DNA-methyltransferase (adenine-specific)